MKRFQKALGIICVAVFFAGCGANGSKDAGPVDSASVEMQIATEVQDEEAEVSEEFAQLQDDTGEVQEEADLQNDVAETGMEETEISLKDYCEDYFSLGVGINGSTLENQMLNSEQYMELSKQHFNSVTMTNLMKSCYILNQAASIESLESGDGSPALDFSTIDPTLQWCMENDMKMRGHTLVWHTQAPEWFFREGYQETGDYVDKDTMLFRMESYIQQMLTHVQENYPGVIYCWDVVNEAVDPEMGDKDSYFRCRMENDGTPNPWYMTIGEDYVEMAFTYARKYADPEVKLFYNDFNTFMLEKRKNIVALCENLKEKGLIDGIGMQGYWGITYPSINSIDDTIRTYAKLDLEIQITELSIGVDEETEEEFEKQAKAYGMVFVTLKGLDTEGGGPANITNVTFFGLVDHYREGDTTNTRLWDKDYQPKPAFEKVKAIFENLY